jgi:hypothetical protein
MSTTPPAPNRTFLQRWKAFWFSPADPTTLAFMRIVTGLLVLYTHLTYSLDLQQFFGKFGWYGSEQIDRERKEYPSIASPLLEWDTPLKPPASPRIPDFPHRRVAVLEFVRRAANEKADRELVSQFIERMSTKELNYATTAYSMVLGLAEEREEPEGERRRLLTALEEGRQLYVEFGERGQKVFVAQPLTDKDGRPRQAVPLFPQFVLDYQPADRAALVEEIKAFIRVLPPDRSRAEYVMIHFMELDQPNRLAFANFLRSVPADDAERKALIDYLGYWNNDPRTVLRQGHPTFSIWFHVTNPTEMGLIHSVVLVIMLLFTIGFCTRLTSVLTWLAAVGYIHRTQQVLFGMDTMMNILLIYLMIGNSGAALSVDRLIARYRAVRASLRRSGTIDEATRAFLAAPLPSVSAGFAIRMVQVHFCFIYLAAGLSKLKGPGWWNGNSFWDVMINPEFTLMRYEWYEVMMRSIASVKPLYYAMTAFGVWFTWGLEVAFPFLIWTRLRPFMLWLGILLHAGIGILMGLNLFELLMMTMLLAYIPGQVVRERLRGGLGLAKLALGFNAADERQARTVAVVAAVDADAQITFESRKGSNQPSVVAAGQPATGPAAVAALFGSLRLLRAVRWLLWVPGVSGLLARWLFAPPPPASGSPPSGGPNPKAPATAS